MRAIQLKKPTKTKSPVENKELPINGTKIIQLTFRFMIYIDLLLVDFVSFDFVVVVPNKHPLQYPVKI